MPVLYCVTFMLVCFLHPLQKARLVLGTFTCSCTEQGGARVSKPQRAQASRGGCEQA